VLAYLEDPRHELRVPGDEGGAVARQVGLLGEGVDGEQSRVVTTADIRVQHAGRRSAELPATPIELRVALVAGHDDAVLACPR
jgi:hypothetical protein